MTFTYENILLVGSGLLILSVLASRTNRFGIPILLLFLFVGMAAGSDGPGGIYFNNPSVTKFIGAFALCFILFSGGLDTKWADIKPILGHGIMLSTLGVIITAIVVGLSASYFAGFTLVEGLLLGAIVSSTDAAAVFSILRSKSIALKGQLRPLLEFESGSNDPMAFFLTILFTFMLTTSDFTGWSMIRLFLQQMVFGAAIGYLMGNLMYRIINWIHLDFDGLYSVLLIAMMLFTFSFTDFIGGNGFLSVYLAGCILGNREFIHKKSLIKHFDGQAWLMQGIMFITLGLLVFPGQVIPYIGTGLLISFVLIFVARPLSVFLSLIFFKLNTRNKFFISWVGLRGAVPIVLATYPLTAGVGKASIIFNLVFFISVTSIILQGTTLSLVAKWLGLSLPISIKRKTIHDQEVSTGPKQIMTKTKVRAGSPVIGRSLKDLKLNGILIISIGRKNQFFTPDGFTQLIEGDDLTILADNQQAIEKFETLYPQ